MVTFGGDFSEKLKWPLHYILQQELGNPHKYYLVVIEQVMCLHFLTSLSMNECAAFCSHTPLMVKWNVHYGVEKEAQSGCSSKPEQKIT